MNIIISKDESSAISIVRILAMTSIVFCHFFQAYENPLAWRFNVGVQVFLVLSGYLYGHKEISGLINWGGWYWNRFIKIYIPCFIYCLFALTILKYEAGVSVKPIDYFTIKAVDGVNHLWFIKAIFLCYIITPVLSIFRKYPLCAYVILIILAAVEFALIQKSMDIFSWLWLYSMGYFYPLLGRRWKIAFICGLICVFALFSVLVEYPHSRVIADLWHYFSGIALCIIGIEVIRRMIDRADLPYSINKLDKMTFPIYITHHIYIIGPLSLVPLFHNRLFCVMVIILAIVASSVILQIISGFFLKLIRK